jgi:hypothetical protein
MLNLYIVLSNPTNFPKHQANLKVGTIIAKMMEKVNHVSHWKSWAHHAATLAAVSLGLSYNLPGELQSNPSTFGSHVLYDTQDHGVVLYLCSGHQADDPYLSYCDADHLVT